MTPEIATLRRWAPAAVVLALVAGAFAPLTVGPSESDGPSAAGPATQAPARPSSSRPPVTFEVNRGQTDSEVRFLSRGPGYGLFLTPGEFVLRLAGAGADVEPAVVRMEMIGANLGAEITGIDPLPGKANYLRGADPAAWVTAIDSFSSVKYQQIYPGIDALFHANSGPLEYDFVVQPDADPGVIGLAVKGALSVSVDAAGDLMLETPQGTLRQPRPTVYQTVSGRRQTVDAAYDLHPGGQVHFRLGPYDTAEPLVIDPVMPHSSYLGGGDHDGANAVATDSRGNTYIAGWTTSADFPKEGGVQAANGGTGVGANFCIQVGRGGCGDGFVTKIAADGSHVVYSTYLGGSDADAATGIAVDGSGRAYVSGYTTSADFPTRNAAQPAIGAPLLPDGFLTQLDADGSAISYSTFLGGTGFDAAHAVAVDAKGKAYVTGSASGGLAAKDMKDPSLPPATACGTQLTTDAFVIKIDPALAGAESVVYAVCLGADGVSDIGRGIAVDDDFNAYVTGKAGDGFPIRSPAQSGYAGGETDPDQLPGLALGEAGHDAFVAKIDPRGSGLVYSTFLGGPGDDGGYGIAVDGAGAAYVTGGAGQGFPTEKAFQPAPKGRFDAFLTKLDPKGKLAYSSYLGGSGDDIGQGVAVDSGGKAFVAGVTAPTSPTASSDFPVKDFPLTDTESGNADAFVAAFDTTRSGTGSLLYSGPLAAAGGDDMANGIAVGRDGAVRVVGTTESPNDFPVTSALQDVAKGGLDAFITELEPAKDGEAAVFDVVPKSGPVGGGTRVVLTGSNLGGVTAVLFGEVEVKPEKTSSDRRRLSVVAPKRNDPGVVVVQVRRGGNFSASSPGARFTYGEGGWREVGAPTVARSFHAAVLLKDGRVLVAGGCLKRNPTGRVCTEPTATAELYDPATGAWTPTANMAVARHSVHVPVLLPDGKVLVVGGVGPDGGQLASAELYDPQARTWTPTKAPNTPAVGPRTLPNLGASDTTRPAVSATLVTTGKVLVVWGTQAELYDPASGNWSLTGEPVRRDEDHRAIPLADGKVLVASSIRSDIYDPASDKWSRTGGIQIPRLGKPGFSLLPDGKVLATGGMSSQGHPYPGRFPSSVGVAEIYDPAATPDDRPGIAGAWQPARSMPEARVGHATIALSDGRVLVVGGAPSERGRVAAAALFDPASSKWLSAGRLNTARGLGTTATRLSDGSVLVVGGGPGFAEVYELNPPPAGPAVDLDDLPNGAASGAGGTKDDEGTSRTPLLAVGAAAVVAACAFVAYRARRRRRTPVRPRHLP